jgi:TfoX/Sxy family transcriptional regulator of competence genes
MEEALASSKLFMSPEDLQQILQETLGHCKSDAMVTFRPMFGGILGYCDGKPFASLSDVGLALKLAPTEQERLLLEAGAERLRYEPDAPASKQYIVVPKEFLTDSERLAEWLDNSLAYVQALPAKKKK